MLHTIVRLLFFGNIFLGICAVLLCFETNLTCGISLNVFPFYLLIFLCTCIYYTMIYLRSRRAVDFDDRTIWYRRHAAAIGTTLKVALLVVTALLSVIFYENFPRFSVLSPVQFIVLAAGLMAPAWYTFSLRILSIRNLRQVGWMKPLIVSLTWSLWISYFPIIIWQVQRGKYVGFSFINTLMWLHNFLFVFMIAVIFDLKDYQTDLRSRLKTYAVAWGVQNTFRWVLVPVLMADITVFFLLQLQLALSYPLLLLQIVPYVCLVSVMLTYRQQKDVLYYLVAVDGLLLVKALSGITGILFKN